MKKFRIAVWVIVWLVIILFCLQNGEYFIKNNQVYNINIIAVKPLAEINNPWLQKIFSEYKSPPLPNVVLVVGFFILGVLITQFMNSLETAKMKGVNKKLTKMMETKDAEIQSLSGEIERLKKGAVFERKSEPLPLDVKPKTPEEKPPIPPKAEKKPEETPKKATEKPAAVDVKSEGKPGKEDKKLS